MTPTPGPQLFCTSSCNLRRVSPRQYRSTGTRTSTSPSCGSTCARRRRSHCVALSILTTEALSTPTSGKYQTNLPHLFLGATYRPFSNVSAPIFASNYSSPSPSRPPRIGSQQPSCSSRFLKLARRSKILTSRGTPRLFSRRSAQRHCVHCPCALARLFWTGYSPQTLKIGRVFELLGHTTTAIRQKLRN